jgi:hypothetical protein
MPQPKFSDIQRFCEIDGWEATKSARGKTGDHYRYRKVLADGTVLRTRTSHSDQQIGDPGLWSRIWRHQLGLSSEEQFWDALSSGDPVDRSTEEPAAPEGPTLPGWLFQKLVMVVGLPEAEVMEMSEEQAKARLNEFYSQPRSDSE